MANEQNLIPYGKGNRSESEEREMRSRGGKRSGETRRRKAALRDTMNRLLTMQVEVEGLPDIYMSFGRRCMMANMQSLTPVPGMLRTEKLSR